MTMSAPRPNLFLIGAMKSATTYLSGLLGEHPSVFMSWPKEPRYFVDSTVRGRVWPHTRKQAPLSTEAYLRLFAAAGDASVIGEASTCYSKAPKFSGVPERILDFSPNARFIYVMRDPVERTISHYWHSVRHDGETRSLLSALQTEPHYLEVSHYARQLEVYFRHVPRDRIYILTYEALLADSAGELSKVYAWLGVDPSFRPVKLGVPVNVTPEKFEQARGKGRLARLREMPFYNRVMPLVPQAVRKLGTRIALRDVRPLDIPIQEAKRFLRSQQRPQTEELRVLLGRSFPEWKSLYGADCSITDEPLSEVSAAALRRQWS